MLRVNEEGYIEQAKGRPKSKSNKRSIKDFWLVKFNKATTTEPISLGKILFPIKYVGKRIKIKVEVLE